MAFSVITGSKTIGNIPNQIDPIFLETMADLEQGNVADNIKDLQGMGLVANFVEEIEGVDGKRVEFEYMNAYFSKGGLASTSSGFDSYKKYFELQRDYFDMKDFDFTIDTVTQAIELGKESELFAEARKKTQKCIQLYNRVFIPSTIIQTLITGDFRRTTIPTLNTNGDYGDQFGALRGEDVINVQPWKSGTARNHYRCLKANANVTADDIVANAQLIKDYKDYSQMGIVAYANGVTMFALRNVFNYNGTIDDVILGKVELVVGGVKFVTLEWLPDNFVLFTDIDASGMIKKMVSPNPTMRGLGMIKEKGWDDLTDPQQLEGTIMRIFPVSYALMKRHKLLWLDIDKTRYNSNGFIPSGGDGEKALNNHALALRNTWFKDLI